MLLRGTTYRLRHGLGTAGQARHEFITLEHMLLGLLHDPVSSEILIACGAKLGALKSNWKTCSMVEVIPEGEPYEPTQTLGFRVACFNGLHRPRSELGQGAREWRQCPCR